MINTGILKEHRSRGVYRKLLPEMLHILQMVGFQVVCSTHIATNNAIIIPKLQAGFSITGFEISDEFGVQVQLSYFFNPLRKQVLEVRTGQLIPGTNILQLLNIVTGETKK